MAVAEATQAGFSPKSPGLGGDFHLNPRFPWDHILSYVPEYTHWTVMRRTHTSKTYWIWNMLGVGLLTRKLLSSASIYPH